MLLPEFDENQLANLQDETVDDVLEKENDELQLQRLEIDYFFRQRFRRSKKN